MTSTGESAPGHVVVSAPVSSLASVYPTYALRAWLTALLAQTRLAQAETQASITNHENEMKRLRVQLDRSDTVVKSLEDAIERVDDVLRSKRDVLINREMETRRGAGPAPEGARPGQPQPGHSGASETPQEQHPSKGASKKK